jgi:hypothetical protein
MTSPLPARSLPVAQARGSGLLGQSHCRMVRVQKIPHPIITVAHEGSGWGLPSGIDLSRTFAKQDDPDR